MYEQLEEELEINKLENEVIEVEQTENDQNIVPPPELVHENSKTNTVKSVKSTRSRKLNTKSSSTISISNNSSQSNSSSVPSLKRLKQSTLNFFQTCLGKTTNTEVVDNDDIYKARTQGQINESRSTVTETKIKTLVSTTSTSTLSSFETTTGAAVQAHQTSDDVGHNSQHNTNTSARSSTFKNFVKNSVEKKNHNTDSTGTSGRNKRNFQPDWLKTFPWIDYKVDKDKVFCSRCTDAVNANVHLPIDGHSAAAKEAFVIDGFSAWPRATTAFRKHESSTLHSSACKGLLSLKEDQISLQKSFSEGLLRSMLRARVALRKIFETVLFFGMEGLAYRASDDKKSKFQKMLRMRSADVPELAEWLNRSQTFKWLHHSTIEEIFQMYANLILTKITEEMKNVKYFSIMMDETSDIARIEQVSVSFRYVSADLKIKEVFIGFYETKSTTADTLFNIYNDVLLRFNLNKDFLRGQSFDGAANVSGIHNGLKALILAEEPRALYIHCVAHRLNLVVQDAMQGVNDIRNFLGTVKDLINFVRDSPKRLAFFSDLQESEAELNDDFHNRKLMRFCETRWCVRVKSLETILSNYVVLCQFFDEVKTDKTTTITSTASAAGFVKEMESFKFYFSLNLLITIFSRIESLNTYFQKKTLTVNKSHAQIQTLIETLQIYRNTGYDEFWSTTTKQADELGVDAPELPKVKRMNRKYDKGSDAHKFSSTKEYFGKLFYEVLDVLMSSLRNRYDTEEAQLMRSIENFVIQKNEKKNEAELDSESDDDESKDDKSNSKSDDELLKDIISFYKDDLNGPALKLHRDMFLDYFNSKKKRNPVSLQEVLDFFVSNDNLWDIVSQMRTLCILILTIPASSVTCERSFSALRLLKTYLRSVLIAKRLNNIAVMYVHKDEYGDLLMEEIENIMDNWIKKK